MLHLEEASRKGHLHIAPPTGRVSSTVRLCFYVALRKRWRRRGAHDLTRTTDTTRKRKIHYVSHNFFKRNTNSNATHSVSLDVDLHLDSMKLGRGGCCGTGSCTIRAATLDVSWFWLSRKSRYASREAKTDCISAEWRPFARKLSRMEAVVCGLWLLASWCSDKFFAFAGGGEEEEKPCLESSSKSNNKQPFKRPEFVV
ncbi:hypothetical protein L596_015782 [Steinernema carpocapsae]|uniref:Uncharacterized protein n=1 Tax=Steinernema carpocapsae TaxID=34508 RepID=A0A4U5NGV1_STECR|nr:hypothetical protein L596_015782 [Steinernema carpocapsae]